MVLCAEGIWASQDPLQPLEALERQRSLARLVVGLAEESTEHKTIMVDATYLKAYRTASSLCVKKGGADARSGEPKVA